MTVNTLPAVTDNDYAEIAVTENTEDFLLNDEPIELMTNAQAAKVAASEMSLTLGQTEAKGSAVDVPVLDSSGSENSGIVGNTSMTDSSDDKRESPSLVSHAVLALRPRKMHVKLGFPSDYFIYERDDDFHRWDKLFPAITREQVKQ
ncbi:hypothetical protein H4S08_004789 [Coemansia sp. RSA 1365]|nr:hypothetical protein H4S08_004789 [Coemansia sp. RSA 1365]